MSNDLISKKALMSHIESERRQWGKDYDAEQILGDIEDFPTAYDTDKVVESFEKERNFLFDKNGCCYSARELISIDKAIESVKSGGAADE